MSISPTQTNLVKPLSSTFFRQNSVLYLWTCTCQKQPAHTCCSSLPVSIVSSERRRETARVLPGQRPPLRNPNTDARDFLGSSTFVHCMASAIWKRVFLAGLTRSAHRGLFTAKFSLTVTDFLINQNDVCNLKREFIGLLRCVSSDDLHLSQSCGRNEPG